MSIHRLKKIFEKVKCHDYIGEAISQFEHALQCAYFAETLGHSEEVILASLLHDIGHVALSNHQPQMADLGVINHEWIGARLALEMGFSKKTAMLIGHHVNAKRYLAAKKERYQASLSQASIGTLKFQGGPMTLAEQSLFESLPFYKEALQVRTNDEKGKDTEMAEPSFEHYLALAQKHIHQEGKKRGKKTIYTYELGPSLPSVIRSLEIVLISVKPPINSDCIYDFNLSVQPTNPHFFFFLDETIALIEESVLNQYGLVASREWINQATKRYPELNWKVCHSIETPAKL